MDWSWKTTTGDRRHHTLVRQRGQPASTRGSPDHPEGEGNTLLEWKPINERLLYARFNSRFIKLSVVTCYAPTGEAEKKGKRQLLRQSSVNFGRHPQT